MNTHLSRVTRDLSVYNFREIQEFFLRHGLPVGDPGNTRGLHLAIEAACWHCGVDTASFMYIPDVNVLKRIVTAFVNAWEPSPIQNVKNGPMPGAQFDIVRCNVGGFMRDKVLCIYA